MSSELFAGMPSIAIPRSKWKAPYNLSATFKHGKLIPMDAIPILPGDGLGIRMRDITWMQTPIAPLFGNIKQSFAAFFVPMRLLWEHTEEFFGANKTNAGFQNGTYVIPHTVFSNGVQVGSVSHYLGKPLASSTDKDGDNKKLIANILKERAYYLCYNEYFRAQQITAPVVVNKSDITANSGTFGVGTINSNVYVDPGDPQYLMSVSKECDYFTCCTLSPQYGAEVEVPLGERAPIFVDGDNMFIGEDSGAEGNLFTGYSSTSGASHPVFAIPEDAQDAPFQDNEKLVPNLYASLRNATAAKINDLRYAFSVQKYLERANYAGNYFFGILQVHYGVTSPDSRLQRPEFLGEFTEDILIQQVISTADTTNNGVATPVGAPGAKSCTVSGTFSLFNKAFVEPGYVVLFRWTKQRQVYSGGLMREDMKRDRYEIYSPEFCNLGDQATKTKELYWKASKDDIFGYQSHWAEYRFRPDRVSGLLDPYAANGLPYWTLAHKFTSKPQLNDTFIKENADDIDRALTTGSSIDEYIFDTWIELLFTREMPVRTMPGLIDHYGAW